VPNWRTRLARFLPRRRLRGLHGGTLDWLHDVWSPQLQNRREVVVYLPPTYGRRRQFPVVYMQDGQNLFDPATAHAGDWRLRSSLDSPARGVGAIIVGVWNRGPERIAEYSPFVDAKNGGGRGDLYLAFLVETLKPMIDSRFRTRPERSQTGIAGSSMGGLISLYGFFRHPGTFGFTAALSPSVWFANRAILSFIKSAAFVAGRIYLDIGAPEGDPHVTNVRSVRDAILAKGYRCAQDFQYLEDADGAHHEAAWGRRFPAALSFLLAGGRPERGEP
jgi:predicted alpha/beta superfamily hydrolase